MLCLISNLATSCRSSILGFRLLLGVLQRFQAALGETNAEGSLKIKNHAPKRFSGCPNHSRQPENPFRLKTFIAKFGKQFRADARHAFGLFIAPCKFNFGIGKSIIQIFAHFVARFFFKRFMRRVAKVFKFLVIAVCAYKRIIRQAVGVRQGSLKNRFAARCQPVAEIIKAVIGTATVHQIRRAP